MNGLNVETIYCVLLFYMLLWNIITHNWEYSLIFMINGGDLW